MIKSLTPHDEAREIISSEEPVLVAFLKKGQRHKEQLDLMAWVEQKYQTRLRCYLYNDSFLETGMRQHFVSGTPSYLLFQDGWEVDRLIGRSDEEMLDQFLDRTLMRLD